MSMFRRLRAAEQTEHMIDRKTIQNLLDVLVCL